ncbi:MAG: cytochrome c biogenesis protein ResB [Candidatus Adiutrix sp.]|jgi:hypothetical protein|nr:cytochrome c biogenesis protein ResB [Candidatus Adiutrix sp.]
MESYPEKMWRFPCSYRENLLIVAALMLGGLAAQLVIGPFDYFFLHYPVNVVLGALILLLALLGRPFSRAPLFRWLGSVPWAVSLILGLMVLSLIMGLTPRLLHLPPEPDFFLRLGLAQMTSCWPFVLIYLLILLSLALVTVRRLRFKRGGLLFFLNHGGLWLLMAAAGLGAADLRRHVMYVNEGQVEWRVYGENKEVLELPLAIRLDDFDLDFYSPKLALVDRHSGRPQPEGRPDWHQIDPGRVDGRLGQWEIRVLEYIHQAVPGEGGGYREIPMPASTPAAHVLARNLASGEIRQGWVLSGNRYVPLSLLALDDNLVVAMTQPEPRRFSSKIKVYTREGQEREAALEVNHPLKIGPWMIYQYGYDQASGRLSPYSSFELVYDPWLLPVQAGLILLAAGALGLIWQGRRRRAAV